VRLPAAAETKIPPSHLRRHGKRIASFLRALSNAFSYPAIDHLFLSLPSSLQLNATRAMYITMHRDSQSTENFQAVAKRIAGFTSVEIVDGVDGTNIPDSDVSLYTR
jgi:hypothetical protein